MVTWALNRSFQCKYVEAIKDITNTSNAMYTLSKCNQPKILSNQMKICYKLKKSLYPNFISPFDTDLRYGHNLFNIVSDTPAPEIVQDCLLSVKDAGKK